MNIYLLARKIIQAIVLAVLMAVIVYVVYRLMPGNPAELFLFGAKHYGATPAQMNALLSELGLSGGKWNLMNFLIYMKDMFTFNFGYDYIRGEPVWEIINYAMPYTLLLLGTALALSFIIGIPLGIVTSWVRGKKSEAFSITISLILNSIPFFILGVILYIYLVSFYHIFPVTSGFSTYYLYHFSWPNFEFVLYKMALPLITLVVIEAAAHVLTMRAAMVSTLGEDYILTARAKGVSEAGIMFRHAARNAMIPVTTRMALEFAGLTGGAVIVEILFSWPGIGHILYYATLMEDYALSEGALFLISLITIIAYVLIDYIHAWLDPRIRV
ncbi:MAG: ABC transporter permease [Thermoplasmata archaeon]|nr:ABC transporter permease [Thermoplasmata archaeon]